MPATRRVADPHVSPASFGARRNGARGARLAKKSSHLESAADLLEQAINRDPKLEGRHVGAAAAFAARHGRVRLPDDLQSINLSADLYRQNAFRILGLPVRCDISKDRLFQQAQRLTTALECVTRRLDSHSYRRI